MQKRWRYLASLTATTVTAVVLTGAFNLIVDPYGTFRLVDTTRFNQTKLYPEHDVATVKSHALRHLHPDALILGNSRAEIGFDPTQPVWNENGYHSVYNAAIPGSDIGSAWNFLEQGEKLGDLKMVVLGVEFFDFLVAPEKPITTTSNHAQEKWADARWWACSTLTMQALIDSMTTLRIQFQKNPAQLTARGFNPLQEYIDLARSEGYYSLFRQRAEENAKNHVRRPANLFANGTRSSTDFEHVRQMLRWSLENKAQLRMVIYPYHVQLLTMIDELGLWSFFEEWKRQLVRIIEEETAANPAQAEAILIDFSGFSGYSLEPIPRQGDRASTLKWYWEAGHFKKELGNLMLARSIGSDAGKIDEGFGAVLNSQNIEAHLQRQREDKASFKATELNAVNEVEELVSAARKKASPPQ